MANMNNVVLIGRLIRDCELRYTQLGDAVCEFGLAVNKKYKQGDDWKEKAMFIDITVWKNQGEVCAEYLHKGSLVCIVGELDYDTWKTDGGQKRSKHKITARQVVFLDPKKEGE